MEAAKTIAKSVDDLLIAKIEEIEGRVPSNEEVTKHAEHIMFPNDTVEWNWKGVPILRQEVRLNEKTGMLEYHIFHL